MTVQVAEQPRSQDRIPVSRVFKNAGWTLSPETYFEMRRGLLRERKRLRGRPWLVLLTRNEIETDGSWYDRFELVETFHQQGDAIDAAWSRLQAAYQEDKKPMLGPVPWQLEAQGPEVKAFNVYGDGAARLQPVFRYGYKLRWASFHIRYGVVHVVRVDLARVIDDLLFDYLRSEWEVISYLIDKGKVRVPAPLESAAYEKHAIAGS